MLERWFKLIGDVAKYVRLRMAAIAWDSFLAVRELGLPMTVVAAQSRSRLRSYGRESPGEPPSWGTEVSA